MHDPLFEAGHFKTKEGTLLRLLFPSLSSKGSFFACVSAFLGILFDSNFRLPSLLVANTHESPFPSSCLVVGGRFSLCVFVFSSLRGSFPKTIFASGTLLDVDLYGELNSV